MKTTDPRFVFGKSDKSWFKKGHKLSPESIEKMRKAKTKYTPEEKVQKEKDRNKNPSRIEWSKNYIKRPERRFHTYKKSAEIKHIEFQLSYSEFLTYWQKDCYYCGSSIETIGLDRQNNSIGYKIDNLVSCCKTCNYMKREMPISQFLDQCQKVYIWKKSSSF